jgi:MFS family permease
MVSPKLAPRPDTQTAYGERPSSFRAWRHRDYRLMWVGQLISVTGSQMQWGAINWHVYSLTHSALALGAVGLVRVVPIILCSLLGGVVADAVDRKRLILATQVLMLLSAAALSLITSMGMQTIWPIYLLTAISSAAVAFEAPARQALLPALVPPEDFQNAVSLYLIVFHVSMIAGPAVAGLLLNSYSPALIYAINAASFVAVICALLMIRASGRVTTAKGEEASRVSFSALFEGLRFVWRTPIIVQTMTLDFIATFFASATALLPIFATEILHVGARGYGILAAAPAMGSVLTALVMARLGTLRRQGAIVIGAVAVYGAATVMFGLSRVFWLSLFCLAVVGAADTVSTVLRQTIRQLSTPNNLRGRMTSVNMIFFMGGPQLGEMEAGAVATLTGSAAIAVVTGGIGCLIAVFVAALMAKTLLRYEGTREAIKTES